MIFFLYMGELIAGSSPDAPDKNVASFKVKDTINKSPVTESAGCYWGGGGKKHKKQKNRKGFVAGVNNLYEKR